MGVGFAAVLPPTGKPHKVPDPNSNMFFFLLLGSQPCTPRDLSPPMNAVRELNADAYAVVRISTGTTARAMEPCTFSTISIFPSMRQWDTLPPSDCAIPGVAARIATSTASRSELSSVEGTELGSLSPAV